MCVRACVCVCVCVRACVRVSVGGEREREWRGRVWGAGNLMCITGMCTLKMPH